VFDRELDRKFGKEFVSPKPNVFYPAMLHFCMPHNQPSPFSPILPLSQQLLARTPKPNTGGVKISVMLCYANQN